MQAKRAWKRPRSRALRQRSGERVWAVTSFSDVCCDVAGAEASGVLVGDCEDCGAETAAGAGMFGRGAAALPNAGGVACSARKNKIARGRSFIRAPNGSAVRTISADRQ